MGKNKRTEIEEKIVSLYREVNPSYYALEDDKALHEQLFLQRQRTLRNSGVYNLLIKSRNILHIGGGTGEKALIDARLSGADTAIVDANPDAIERAKSLFSGYKQTLHAECKSLFDMDAKDVRNFDLILCEGVLHHTFDPIVALKHVCRTIPEGAILFVAMAEENGWYQRQMQRDFVLLNASNPEEIMARAKTYFSDHILRAQKYGLRSEKQVIFDTFINPHIQTSSIENILSVFGACGCKLIQSFPSLASPFHMGPVNTHELDDFDHPSYSKYLNFLKMLWRTGYHSPMDVIQETVLLRRIENLDNKLRTLRREITEGKDLPKHLKLIQSGPMGYGQNHFTVCKI